MNSPKEFPRQPKAMAGKSRLRPRRSMHALESRIVFDGAAAVDALAQASADAVIQPDAVAPVASARTEIVFVESNIRDYQTLLDGIAPGAEVHVLDAAQDGLAQIAGILDGRSGIDAIHILSHGAAGELGLGTLTLTSQNLQEHSGDLASIGSVLSQNADILLYGCDVGAGTAGSAFMDALSQATQADIAASNDLTGAAQKGGNWVLEAASGQIEAAALQFSGYQDILPSVAGTISLSGQANYTDYGVVFSDGEGGSTDIAGIQYDFFFTNSANTQISTVYAYNVNLGTALSTLSESSAGITAATSFAVFKSSAGENFKLTSFSVQDSGGYDGTWSVQAYENGGAVGAAQTFTIAQSGDYNTTVTLSTDFQNIDEVRISRSGGISGGFLWDAGFYNIVVADPVIPDTTPPVVQSIAPTGSPAANAASITYRVTFDESASSVSTDDFQLTATGSASGTIASVSASSGTTIDVTVNSIAGDGTLRLDLKSNTNIVDGAGNGNNTNGYVAAYSSGTVHTVDRVAPSFTSSAAPSVPENTTAVVTLAATDTNAVTYALNGGADAAKFQITGGNNLSFLSAPNFESAGDVGADNVYNVTVRATDSAGNVTDQNIAVTVTDANEAPVNTKPATQTTNEDTPLVFSAGNGNALSVTDVDSGTTLTTVVSVVNGTGTLAVTTGGGSTITGDGSNSVQIVGTVAQVQAALASVTYTPAANANGTGYATLTISTTDNGTGTLSDSDTVTIDVTAVNDVPSFTKGANQTVNEDAGAQTIAGWATSLSTGPADESGQTLSFNVTNDNNALFSAQPAIDANGQLTYTPAANANGTATVTVSIQDNGGGTNTSATQTFTITVTAVNDAPAVGGATAVTNINDTATATPFSTFTITDADTAQSQTLTVTLDAAAKGALSNLSGGTYTAGTGVYSFTGTAAAAQAAIRGLVFTPTANRVASGLTEITTFTVSVSDGIAAAATDATTTVVATSVNDAPTISGASAGQAVNDNATVSPFTGITIGDADAPAQTQTVSVTLDTAAKGSFTTLNGFIDAGGGVYTFSGTAAAATTAIRGLVFTPTANRVNPTLTETTTFTISTDDGVAAATTNNTTTVVSSSVNDAPAVGGATAVTNINDTATATPFSAFTISDADTAQSQTLTVTLDTAAKGALSNLSGGTYTAGTGVYSFTGTAAQAQAAIRALVFTPTANRVASAGTETTTFTVSVSDGVAAAATDATTTVVSTSINDAPVLDAGQSPALAGMGINPAAPSNGSTTGSTLVSALVGGITDADTGAVKGIAITAIDTVNGTLYYSTNGGTTWTAVGAVAANSALLLASDANTRLYYQSGNGVSGNIASALTFRAWDLTSGTAGNKVDTTTNGNATAFSTATDTISIAIYPPPTIGSVSAGQAVNDNATVSPFAGTTIANAGTGNNVTVTVALDTQAKGSFTTLSGFTDNGNGTCTLTNVTAAAAQTAIRGLVFTPTANRVNPTLTETTTFTLTVTDVTTTVAATDATTTVVSTSINDAPAVGGAAANQAVNDNATLSPFSTFTITDADTAQSQTLTVTLDTAAKGALSNLGGGTYNAGTGVYTFTGTAAQAQAAIRGLVFTPTANRVNPTLTETTTFTVSVNDAIAAAATDATTTVVATSINDAPTVGGATAVNNLNVATTASATPFTAFTVTDADTAQTQTVTVTLDTAAKGALSNLSGGAYDAGTGVYTFTGTAAQAQAAIRALVFTPTANRVTTGATETTTFTVSVDDGIAAAASDNTTTVVVTNVPPPVVVTPPPVTPPPVTPPPVTPPPVTPPPVTPPPVTPPPVTPPPVEPPPVVTPPPPPPPVVAPPPPAPPAPPPAPPAPPAPTPPIVAPVVAPPPPSAPPVAPISVLPDPVLPSGTIPQSSLVVDHGIGNLSVGAGQSFTYVIPRDAFLSSSSDARLSFQATQANGAPLPNWLRFNPETGTFSGVVPEGVRGDLRIRVKAVDSKGNEVVTTFTIKSGVVARENGNQHEDGNQPGNDEPRQRQRGAAPLSGQGLLSVLGVPGFDAGLQPDAPTDRVAGQQAEPDEAVPSEGQAPQLSAQLQREAQRFGQARDATLRHLAAVDQARQLA